MPRPTSFQVEHFLKALDELFLTQYSPHIPPGEDYCPVLATVLMTRYRHPTFLALNAYDLGWFLSQHAIPENGAVLVIEIPELTGRMYRLLLEEQLSPCDVVDITALREQMMGAIRDSYRLTYGPAS